MPASKTLELQELPGSDTAAVYPAADGLERYETYEARYLEARIGPTDTWAFNRGELQAVAGLAQLQQRAAGDSGLADHFRRAGFDLSALDHNNLPDTRTIQGLLNLSKEYDRLPALPCQGAHAGPSLSSAALDSAKRFGGKVVFQGGRLAEFLLKTNDNSGDIMPLVESAATPENRKRMLVAAAALGLVAQLHPYSGTAPAEHAERAKVSAAAQPFVKLASKLTPEEQAGVITPAKAVDSIQALAHKLAFTARAKQLPGNADHPVALLVQQAAKHFAGEVAKHDPESAQLAQSMASLATVIATHPQALDKTTAAALAQPESPAQAQMAHQIKQELFGAAPDPNYIDPDQAAALSNLMAMLALDSTPPAAEQPGNQADGAPAEQAAPAGFDLGTALAAMEAKGNQEHADWANAAVAIRYFTDKGLTLEQASGVVGNFWVESSGVNPAQAQYGGGPGRGLAQWEKGGRWDVLVRFAHDAGRDPYALDTQLDFAWHELNYNRQLALQKVLQTNTPEGAAVAFEKYYEGAGVPALNAREQAARMLYNEVHAASGPQAPEQTPTDPSTPSSAPLQTAASAELPPNPNVPAAINGVVHWSQHDHRWAGWKYSAINDPEQTISTSGCEPASMAMVVSTLTGAVVTPPDMARFALQHGDRTANSGTTAAAIPEAAATYGLQATPVRSAGDILAALDANTSDQVQKLVILNGQDFNPATPPTASGHWYVISQDAGNGKVRVNDPNSIERSMQAWDLQQLVNASTSMWVISK